MPPPCHQHAKMPQPRTANATCHRPSPIAHLLHAAMPCHIQRGPCLSTSLIVGPASAPPPLLLSRRRPMQRSYDRPSTMQLPCRHGLPSISHPAPARPLRSLPALSFPFISTNRPSTVPGACSCSIDAQNVLPSAPFFLVIDFSSSWNVVRCIFLLSVVPGQSSNSPFGQ